MPSIPDSRSKLKLAGKSVEFFSANGVVLSNQKWSESHTYSSGVGSYHNTSIGFIALPQVKSYAVENQEVWLRLENGQDLQCRYAGQTIPVTSGQRISVLAMAIRGQVYANLAIVNHATNRWHVIGDLDWLVDSQLFRKPSWLKTFLIATSGWFLIGLVAGFAITAGAPAMKAAINSPPVQVTSAFLIRVLPTLPGATDRGESLVAYMAFTAFFLLLVPPIYALWRHAKRYVRFEQTVETLSNHLGRLAQFVH